MLLSIIGFLVLLVVGIILIINAFGLLVISNAFSGSTTIGEKIFIFIMFLFGSTLIWSAITNSPFSIVANN